MLVFPGSLCAGRIGALPVGHESVIDIVRVIACLGVVLGHVVVFAFFNFAGPNDPHLLAYRNLFWVRLFSIGKLGVNIFFLLGGFLLAKASRQQRNLVGLREKIVMRIVRYYVVVVVALVYGYLCGDTSLAQFLPVLCFALNYYYFYTNPVITSVISYHMVSFWSTCVDFHVHLVFDLLALINASVRKIQYKFIFGALLLSIYMRARNFDFYNCNIASLQKALYLPGSLTPDMAERLQEHYHFTLPIPPSQCGATFDYVGYLFFPSHARFGSYILGFLLYRLTADGDNSAAGHFYRRLMNSHWKFCILPFACALMLVPLIPSAEPIAYPAAWIFTVLYDLLFTASAGVLITPFLLRSQGSLKNRNLRWWWAAGKLTYGVYIYHPRIIHYLLLSALRPTGATVNLFLILSVWLLAVGIAVVFSALTFIFLEVPVQNALKGYFAGVKS